MAKPPKAHKGQAKVTVHVFYSDPDKDEGQEGQWWECELSGDVEDKKDSPFANQDANNVRVDVKIGKHSFKINLDSPYGRPYSGK